jgi:hypothetical protein
MAVGDTDKRRDDSGNGPRKRETVKKDGGGDKRADYGGGVALIDGKNEFYMSGGVITNNRVEWHGGGVLAQANSTFNMTGGEITGNSAGWNGGGVYTGSNFNMTEGEITNNDAGAAGGRDSTNR